MNVSGEDRFNESAFRSMAIGIIDNRDEITGCLNRDFYCDGFGPVSGRFTAKVLSHQVVLAFESDREIPPLPAIRLRAINSSTFTLFHVTIGKQFHWEREESQTFEGDLLLRARGEGTMAAINEISLEGYLKSVVSSEMSGNAPLEFLKAHAIISRSWLVSALDRKIGKISVDSRKNDGSVNQPETSVDHDSTHMQEIIRWYEQEDHDIYDVCADDHCQRYQGVTKIVSPRAEESVRSTMGQVITYKGEVCDARYSKACGGVTECFETAWADHPIPYLTSVLDGPVAYRPVLTEEDAAWWILSNPDAFCNAKDSDVLRQILPDFDFETKSFFRWTVSYKRRELEDTLREKSGIDFGQLKEIEPLARGSSGRIFKLKITGSAKSVIVGKELEIRRWLSNSHLYSSAFIVETELDGLGEVESFIFHGAGWGHGVGLCQIGAAQMAIDGFSSEEILAHYFPGTEIGRIY
jgi:stage II sporulation protein D